MHYRFLVTFNKEDAANSQEAREHAATTLLNEGFVYANTRWSCGLADWFVIGGRWSGELSRHSWARDITAQMRAIEKQHDVQVWGTYYGDNAKKKKQAELLTQFTKTTKMWQDVALPEYKDIPYQRDTYKEDGYEDDAMLLTQEIYDGLLKKYEGSEESENHADLDNEEVSAEMIGQKWIVVVDYHT